jgi:beta-N-acetylhexosaminidase
MTAHITVPEITGARTPATLAPAVLTDLLRDEMGFGGLVVTDAMDMAAVDRMFKRGEAAVLALEAGADVILMPPDVGAARAGIVEAVESGRLTEARIDRSVLRILRAKEKLGLDRQRTVDIRRVRQVVGVQAHTSVARRVANSSVTVLKDERELLPLLGTPNASVYSVTYRRPTDLRAGRAFNASLRQTYRRLRTGYVEPGTTRAEYDQVLARARQMSLTVVSLHVGVRTASGSVALPEQALRFVRELARSGKPSIVVAFGNPYLLSEFPDVGTYLTAWSGVPVAERAAADAILGRIAVTGRAPTRIGAFEIGDGLQIPARGEAAIN